MTEEEWLKASSPVPLLTFLAYAGSTRKLRLFLCACFRILEQVKWKENHFEVDRAAVELAECWAEGLVDQSEVFTSGVISPNTVALFPNEGELRQRALWGGLVTANPPFRKSFEEEAVRTDLLRDIFGNPFRSVAFSPSWRTDTVLSLANQMYDSRDFGAMPILADALQDAGCENEEILNHCRDPRGIHARGCWVIDLVLGKA
jgi:hypothetical protein